MGKLVSIGELIIDFQSVGYGSLATTKEFVKNPGGAPANVCVQAAKNGVEACYISKVGAEGFGDFLIDSLKTEGVNVDGIKISSDYQTSLAFVSIEENGQRHFSFYRKNAADLYFTLDDIKGVLINENDIFHFGSVALKTEESRLVHRELIKRASKSIVSFDPNVRLNLWDSKEELIKVINDYLPFADIIKISDDELELVTGISLESKALEKLFKLNAKMILISRGSKGSTLYLKDGRVFNHLGYKVNAIDTTGAGDSFFGGFLTRIIEEGLTKNTLLNSTSDYSEYLDFASQCGAYTTTKYGAISAMGSRKEIREALARKK